jgi:hypothetical protein
MVARGPFTQKPGEWRKIERWHQTLKNRILLENHFLPGDLEPPISARMPTHLRQSPDNSLAHSTVHREIRLAGGARSPSKPESLPTLMRCCLRKSRSVLSGNRPANIPREPEWLCSDAKKAADGPPLKLLMRQSVTG